MYKCTRPLSVQARYSKSCPIINFSCYNGCLLTWTVVCLTAAKFKSLIFLVPGFALSNVANIFIFMILYKQLSWTRSVAWYSMGADRIENTASNSVSIVALWSLPINGCCLFCGRCLVTGLYATTVSATAERSTWPECWLSKLGY
jgi:hypothetical protein